MRRLPVVFAEGYKTKQVTIDVTDDEQKTAQLIPALPHFFVSERTGEFEVYSIDADGENEELVLPATGTERDNITLLPHPTKPILAVILTRDGVRNDDDFLLSGLTIVDPADDEIISVMQSERIQLVGWFEDRIVYVRIAEGASGTNPGRHRLMSYDYERDRETELARSNYFNGVQAAGEFIYYAPSSIFQEEPTSLYRIRSDGSGQQAVLGRESWGLYRTAYDEFTVATSDTWFNYNISTDEREELEGEPANIANTLYVDNPWSDVSAFVERRDGQGVLFVHSSDESEPIAIHEAPGLSYPLRWLNETTIVYRIDTNDEIADYALSTSGGDPKRIQQVTSSSSLERWYVR